MKAYRLYTPTLRPDLVRALYRLKQQTGSPMTQLLAEAVEKYLKVQEVEVNGVENN